MAQGSLQEALGRLYRRRTFGVKPGLDVEREMLRRMGNPESHYPVIHVAGTNGKGSVCALLDSILRSVGYGVGLYTSPHLIRFQERIRVGGKAIDEGELSDLVELVEGVSEDVCRDTGREPTFFECATAMGFEYFRRQEVDAAVVEVGMGGRLDATNVVVPVVSVITRISLEHTAYLGVDIETIAAEKGGIIKPGRPVVCGATDPTALNVLRRIAEERGAALVAAEEDVQIHEKPGDSLRPEVEAETPGATYHSLRSALMGEYQVENLATALAAVDMWNDASDLPVDEGAVSRGVECVKWPGRFQILKTSPLVVLDGAHNPGAVAALVRATRRLIGDRPLGLVFGMCRDKDIESSLRVFSGMVKRLWAVSIESEAERTASASMICEAGNSLGWESTESHLLLALKESETWATENGGSVLICGSLFLAGEVLAAMEQRGPGCREPGEIP